MKLRRFSAYELAGAWWVTLEPLKLTDDPSLRWRWSLRPIAWRTPNGTVIPGDLAGIGYSYNKVRARAAAYEFALTLSSKG